MKGKGEGAWGGAKVRNQLVTDLGATLQQQNKCGHSNQEVTHDLPIHNPRTCSSCPTKSVGSQPLYCPPRMYTSASATRLAAASVSAAASSAVVSVSTPGVLPT